MATLEEHLALLITDIGADINDLQTSRVFIWSTGDATPGSTPAGHKYIFNLATADSLPGWAPAGSIVIRS